MSSAADSRVVAAAVGGAVCGAGLFWLLSGQHKSAPAPVPSTPPVSTSSVPTLESDLKFNSDRDLENCNHARNHVAMTLTALYNLRDHQCSTKGRLPKLLVENKQKTSDPIALYKDNIVPRINRPLPPNYIQDLELAPLTRDTWKNCLGKISDTTALNRFFVEELNSDRFGGSGEKLAKHYVPQLSRGLCCFAFHSMLRMAFAFDANNDVEVAISLGHIASGYFEAPKAASHYADATERLLANPGLKKVECPTQGNIDTRIKHFFEQKEFQENVPNAAGPGGVVFGNIFNKLRGIIVGQFLETHHFALMHALSSLAALQTMQERLGAEVINLEVVNAYWAFVLAVVLAIRNLGPAPSTVKRVELAVKPDASLKPDSSNWEEICDSLFLVVANNVDTLSTSNYEHQVKCVYSCILEAKRCPGLESDLKQIAIREVNVPSPYW